jgi:hypothetical protein
MRRDNRPVAVDIAVRRDKEMQANADMITLPVAILNHGNRAAHAGMDKFIGSDRGAAPRIWYQNKQRTKRLVKTSLTT